MNISKEALIDEIFYASNMIHDLTVVEKKTATKFGFISVKCAAGIILCETMRREFQGFLHIWAEFYYVERRDESGHVEYASRLLKSDAIFANFVLVKMVGEGFMQWCEPQPNSDIIDIIKVAGLTREISAAVYDYEEDRRTA